MNFLFGNKNTDKAESKQGLSQYDETLVDEFCYLVASIAVRLLTKEDAERDNRGTLEQGEAKKL